MLSFSTRSGLDPGDDPADSGLATNRLSLNKTYHDEVGRVYKTEWFMDPSDATPAGCIHGSALNGKLVASRITVTNELFGPRVQVLLTDLDAFAEGRRLGLG